MFGQKKNLITNGGFSDYNQKPTGSANLDDFYPWFDPSNGSASPDVFHPKGKGSADLPNKKDHFFDLKKSGIAGIILYSDNAYTPDYREYLAVKLDESIKKGMKYSFTFKYCNEIFIDTNKEKLEEKFNFFIKQNTGNESVRKFGIAFYKFKPSKKITELLEPDCYYEIDTYNEYYKNWTPHKISFTAKDNYRYVVIGNFESDEDTDVKKHKDNRALVDQAYYFFDDFQLYQNYNSISKPPKNSCETQDYPLLGINQNKVDSIKLFTLKNLYFRTDSSSILPSSIPILNELIDFLNSNNNLEIVIEGHTNNKCETDFCNTLSQKRADAVRKYLINKNVSNPGRISARGFGKENPKSITNQALNQRVEIKIISRHH